MLLYPPLVKLKGEARQSMQRRPSQINWMTLENNPEAFLNGFEQSACAVGWPEWQSAAFLSPCLVGPLQEATVILATDEA